MGEKEVKIIQPPAVSHHFSPFFAHLLCFLRALASCEASRRFRYL